ncbi:translation initiation factor IF-2-like [Motacilla alba alba]|uniref:translation initiation factor IF-2-like n=1 Tax=Motacilla alba alba TaxID=1094192 RepID=UPI0018D4E5DF|nr:translation initiation factor IF-2-like [Motacilla alba alba]
MSDAGRERGRGEGGEAAAPPPAARRPFKPRARSGGAGRWPARLPGGRCPARPLTPPRAGLPPRLRPPASRRAGRGGGPGRRAVRGSARPCLRGRRRRAERPCAQRGALSATMRRLPLPCLLLLPPLLLLLPAEVRPSCGRRGAAAPAPAAPAWRGRCAAGLGLCPAAAPPVPAAEGRAGSAGGRAVARAGRCSPGAGAPRPPPVPRPAAAGAVLRFNPAVQPRGSFRGMRLPRLFSWVKAALGTTGTAPVRPVLEPALLVSVLVNYVNGVYVVAGSLRVARSGGAHHPRGYSFRDQRGVSPGRRCRGAERAALAVPGSRSAGGLGQRAWL